MRKFLIVTACGLVAAATPALAQSGLDGRVGKLESEMRAVQRKVFPGGGTYVEPQITQAPAPAQNIGTAASSPVADLTQRVTSLEGQIATLTGQIEQNQYRVRQLEEQFAAYKRTTDARLTERAEPAPIAPSGNDAASVAPPPTRATTDRTGGKVGSKTASRAEDGAAASNDPARSARAAALEKPSTGDAGEDAYLYGYRLWQAKLYPEAEAQLKKTVADYPKHKRASFAQNLLGRAYLDDGKPSLASIAFYDNYKKYPDGERAPDSLMYLAQALVKLKKPADACKVYGELTDVYGARLSAAQQAEVTRGRGVAACK